MEDTVKVAEASQHIRYDRVHSRRIRNVSSTHQDPIRASQPGQNSLYLGSGCATADEYDVGRPIRQQVLGQGHSDAPEPTDDEVGASTTHPRGAGQADLSITLLGDEPAPLHVEGAGRFGRCPFRRHHSRDIGAFCI